MKIKILGSGHAYEVPNLNCDCTSCYAQRNSGDSRDIRLRTSMAIKQPNENDFILIDAGPDYRFQQKMLREFVSAKEGESLAETMHLFQTHYHWDHCLGLPELEAAARKKKKIPLYAHEKGFERMSTLDMEYLTKDFIFGGIIEKNVITPRKDISVAGLTITPFKVEHGGIAPGSVGYDITSKEGRFVYTGDFGSMENPEQLHSSGKTIDLLVAECNWFNTIGRKDHMSFQRVTEYIKLWNPDNFMLIHLGSDDELHPEEDSSEVPFKQKADNPLPIKIPSTHKEWISSVSEFLESDSSLKKYLHQKYPLIAFDGLELKI